MQSESIVTCQFSTKPNKEMHFHQDIEIIYVLDGVLEVIFEKEEKLLKTDEFLLVNTNVRHCYRGCSAAGACISCAILQKKNQRAMTICGILSGSFLIITIRMRGREIF